MFGADESHGKAETVQAAVEAVVEAAVEAAVPAAPVAPVSVAVNR